MCKCKQGFEGDGQVECRGKQILKIKKIKQSIDNNGRCHGDPLEFNMPSKCGKLFSHI